MRTNTKLIGAGVLSAIAASICCITPVLALLAGTSGLASTFSWIEPFRPYLAGLTILVLGLAWYYQLRPKEQIDCNCETEDFHAGKVEKPKFIQSQAFLGIVTVFTALMLAFPMYAHIFNPEAEKEVPVIDGSNVQRIEFSISGMTCSGCEKHITHELMKFPGIINSTPSYEKENAIVEFDPSKMSVAKIEEAINSTGYVVTDKKER